MGLKECGTTCYCATTCFFPVIVDICRWKVKGVRIFSSYLWDSQSAESLSSGQRERACLSVDASSDIMVRECAPVRSRPLGGSRESHFYEADWEQPWFLPVATCHRLFSLHLVPTNLTHLLKVQTSTYITVITLLIILGLEDFTNLISSLVIKGRGFIIWALSQRKSLNRGFPGISSGHSFGKKYQERLINWEQRQELRVGTLDEGEEEF